jgi:hypothetical protein
MTSQEGYQWVSLPYTNRGLYLNGNGLGYVRVFSKGDQWRMYRRDTHYSRTFSYVYS